MLKELLNETDYWQYIEDDTKYHVRIMFSWFFHIGWGNGNASNGIINKGLNRMKRKQIGYFSCLEFLVFWAVIIVGFLVITGKVF